MREKRNYYATVRRKNSATKTTRNLTIAGRRKISTKGEDPGLAGGTREK